jgi:hypothetical protein
MQMRRSRQSDSTLHLARHTSFWRRGERRREEEKRGGEGRGGEERKRQYIPHIGSAFSFDPFVLGTWFASSHKIVCIHTRHSYNASTVVNPDQALRAMLICCVWKDCGSLSRSMRCSSSHYRASSLEGASWHKQLPCWEPRGRPSCGAGALRLGACSFSWPTRA